MQPAVQKAPTVNIPTQPTYTAQVLNQQPQKTDTAATPTFKQLIDKKIFDNSELKHIKDLSSLHRQWAICASSDITLPPKKLSKIYHSYLFASQLISKLTNNK